MKLVVGSRGNFKSTRSIIDGTGGRIAEIYLSVENSRFGSGRNYVHEISLPQVARQVAYAKKFGVEISLAFNTVCFGKEKFNDGFQNEFRRLLEGLETAGVNKIILSDPFLMEITRDEFPGMQIIVSVFAEVDSINRLQFYNRLGVDRIILPHELNRDLKTLRDFVQNSQCDLEVILNLGCSHYCARGDAHSMFTGHFVNEMRKSVFGDCYTVWCNCHKLNHPEEFLSQDWIRPEDIYRYEEIGIRYFKLAGRATSTSWIIRAANAYLDRNYNGNFFELIAPYYPFTDRIPKEKTPFCLPNRSLDGVMNFLYNCGQKCEGCNICLMMAKDLMIL